MGFDRPIRPQTHAQRGLLQSGVACRSRADTHMLIAA
jgi:hypothetical protein